MIRALLIGFGLLLALDVTARCDRVPSLAIEQTRPPLARADYPLCVTVRPSPLLRTPRGSMDMRVGDPANDRGVI
jgi:hypothetical protein